MLMSPTIPADRDGYITEFYPLMLRISSLLGGARGNKEAPHVFPGKSPYSWEVNKILLVPGDEVALKLPMNYTVYSY